MLDAPVSECSTCSNKCCPCCLHCAGINPDIPTFYWSPDKDAIKKYVLDYIGLKNMDGIAPGWEFAAFGLGRFGVNLELWMEAVRSLLIDKEIAPFPAGGYVRVGFEDWLIKTLP